MTASTDQQTMAELARHNQELSLALSAAEQRARTAERERDSYKAGADEEARAGDEARAEVNRLRRVVDEDIPQMLTAVRDVLSDDANEQVTEAVWTFEGQVGHRIKTLLGVPPALADRKSEGSAP